jgi:ABC-type branched-subunit amino acid transport system ATPase component
MRLLNVRGLTKRFGGLTALENVDLTVDAGEIVSVIGPNGAGKTTFFNLLTGFYRADGGRVEFSGERIDDLPAHRIVKRGLARTFQNIRLFPCMTALENVMVGRHCRTRSELWPALFRTRAFYREEREIRRTAEERLRAVGLEAQAHTPAQHLSYGDQRRLEIARALATEPRLLLLDEPNAGMNPRESLTLMETIRGLRREGGHDPAHRARHAGGHGSLRPGRRFGLRQEDRRGGNRSRSRRTPGSSKPIWERDAPMLNVSGLRVSYGRKGRGAPRDRLHRGRGRNCLPDRCEWGGQKHAPQNHFRPLETRRRDGDFRGRADRRATGPRRRGAGARARSRGPAYFPASFGPRKFGNGRLPPPGPGRAGADPWNGSRRSFPCWASVSARRAAPSPGGEQQMLAIGRALMARPRLLMLDEPSMGLAPLVVDKIFSILRDIHREGTTLLLVEQNANEALRLADRGYVIETGRLAHAGSAADLRRDPAVRNAYLGVV